MGHPMVKTNELSALSLGDDNLYQSYFVCLDQTFDNTLISFGKTLENSKDGDAYLVCIDNSKPLPIKFYAFGNKKEAVEVLHVSYVPHRLMNIRCKGTSSLYMDFERAVCVPRCHELCEPLAGRLNCLDNGSYYD